MKSFFKSMRYLAEYLLVLLPLKILPKLSIGMIKRLASLIAAAAWRYASVRKLLTANIKCAMPELTDEEIKNIARRSLFNASFNFLEYAWIDGREERIRERYVLPPDVTAALKGHVAKGERIIFVNPHLGSWEASGTMAPFYAGVNMVAIAKKVKNPMLNKLLNRKYREKTSGLEIIMSNGAMRESIHALKQGKGLGMLIDQNTRCRNGGEFVDFFGIPCPSSVAPATLKRYADSHNIPAVIIYGTSLRTEDGKITASFAYLPQPFESYADDRAVINALMKISEEFIRKNPDQYLWFYKRFQYIAEDATAEQLARYPYYAIRPPEKFFRKISPVQERK